MRFLYVDINIQNIMKILLLFVIFCLTCSAKQKVNNSSMSFVGDVIISQPQMLCRKAIHGSKNGATLVFSWSCLNDKCGSLSFIVEFRNSSSDWRYVGLTKETFMENVYLESASFIQLRVLPILPPSHALLPVTSNWIRVESFPSIFTAPRNIQVSDFAIEGSQVKAVVRWNASKEFPCFYEIFWHHSIKSDSLTASEKAVLPHGHLSLTIFGLLFNVNYTVRITPLNKGVTGKTESAETWFLTPTCLGLTRHNFNLCAPSKPMNVTVYLNSTGFMLLNWSPPKNTSSKNPVLGYRIFVLANKSKYIDFKAVASGTLSTSFALLNGTNDYNFEIRAVSKGGIGSAAFAEIELNVMSAGLSFSLVPNSNIWIVMSAVVIFVAVLLGSLIIYRKTPKFRGYPSGVADVYSSLLPLLVPTDRIQLTSILGKGSFGVVHKGIYTRNKSDETVAVKVLPSDSNTRCQLLHEVEIMNIVGRHEKVVGLIGFSLGIEEAFLILEYCPMGDLHSYLLKKKPELLRMKSLPSITPTEHTKMSTKKLHLGKRLCLYINQVAEGMEYVASLKLIHRDVAARNVLMVDRDRVKIADFGLSRDVYQTGYYLSSNNEGRLPIKWMAPEAIQNHKFSTQSDVWSFGVFMWEVFRFGKEPYTGLSNSKVLEFVQSGYRLEWPNCRPEWYDLMLECWHDNPRRRPPFRELVKRITGIIDTMYHYTVFF